MRHEVTLYLLGSVTFILKSLRVTPFYDCPNIIQRQTVGLFHRID